MVFINEGSRKDQNIIATKNQILDMIPSGMILTVLQKGKDKKISLMSFIGKYCEVIPATCFRTLRMGL